MEIMVLILFLSPPPQDLSQANVSHSLHVQSTISKEIGIILVVSNQTRSKDQNADSNPIFNVILFFISNADKKFSFLNADELAKMKEEEGKSL